LCNDNLSGIAVQTFLARAVASSPRRYTYRFVFAPGTIGAISWLSLNEKRLARVRAGMVLALLGDSGPITYKRTRSGDCWIDRVLEYALKASQSKYRTIRFSPYGYDERQFGSPGIDVPVGRLTRTPNGEYPEYHTSADNLELVSAESLRESLEICLSAVKIIESDRYFVNANPKCEPQLGRRGLYAPMGGVQDIADYHHALLWLLSFSEGKHSLLDIARKADLPFDVIVEAARALQGAGLLTSASQN
jgi:aminopeptidase-like protein